MFMISTRRKQATILLRIIAFQSYMSISKNVDMWTCGHADCMWTCGCPILNQTGGPNLWIFLITYHNHWMKIKEQSKEVDIHSLIGNIGGYVGLFLGTDITLLV